MSDFEKNEIVRNLVDSEDMSISETELNMFLSLAKEMILTRMNDPKADEVPDKYSYLHCRLTASLYLRKGAEGETRHVENGITREYQSAGLEDILSEVLPVVRICL